MNVSLAVHKPTTYLTRLRYKHLLIHISIKNDRPSIHHFQFFVCFSLRGKLRGYATAMRQMIRIIINRISVENCTHTVVSKTVRNCIFKDCFPLHQLVMCIKQQSANIHNYRLHTVLQQQAVHCSAYTPTKCTTKIC